MSRNPGVKVRTGTMDSLTNKPCRSCGVMMDDGGTHYVCLACGYRMEKVDKPAGELSAWQKQVADLHSQKFLSARQAQGVQMMAGFGPLRVVLFIVVAALAGMGPLQNVIPYITYSKAGPFALQTAVGMLILVAITAWASLGQPGNQRMLQRNAMAVLSLVSLAGLLLAGKLNPLLAAQYAAMHNYTGTGEGVMHGIASVPAWWQAPLLCGGLFVALAGLAFICHREAGEQIY